MELRGTVQNGVVVPDEQLPLPDGARVRILLDGDGSAPRTTKEHNSEEIPTLVPFLKYAGCMPDLPADFASQHDHYLHGTPKR